MVDPVTIGGLVAGALVAAANGTATEAAKDAYKWLKAKLAPAAATEVAQLEAAPASQARAAVVAEIVDARPAAEQAELKQLAQALAAALAAEGKVPATTLLTDRGDLGANSCLRKVFMDRANLYAYSGYESMRGRRPSIYILPLSEIAAIEVVPNPALCAP